MKVKGVVPKQVNVHALKRLAERRTVQRAYSQTGCDSQVTSPAQKRNRHTTREMHASEASTAGVGLLPAFATNSHAVRRITDQAWPTRVAARVLDNGSPTDDATAAASRKASHILPTERPNMAVDLEPTDPFQVRRLQDQNNFA